MFLVQLLVKRGKNVFEFLDKTIKSITVVCSNLTEKLEWMYYKFTGQVKRRELWILIQ